MKIFNYPKDKDKILKIWDSSLLFDIKFESLIYNIINEVKKNGDQALIGFAKKFDGVKISKNDLQISQDQLKTAWDNSSDLLKTSLKHAYKNIFEFHKKQLRKGWTIRRKNGVKLSQRITPLKRIGIYIPGGRAPYPSTVLMNAIPAIVAGVKEIVLVTPPPKNDDSSETILAAAYMLGIKEAYWVGGAQAVAALAYGTETIKKVDKVVGPGNKFVAAAKKLLFGEIDIDSIAGPSEILIIADNSSPVEFIAADLLSQAEHDDDAIAIAILIEPFPIDYLLFEIDRQTKIQPRVETIKKSLKNNGMIIKVKSRDYAVELANIRAPEHLEIMTVKVKNLADKINNVGAIFLGNLTPEPIGDYVAGPNHVLPTSGTARFFSPLCVDDFLKTSNCLEYSQRGVFEDGDAAINIAEAEGFFAHAESVRKRLLLNKRRNRK